MKDKLNEKLKDEEVSKENLPGETVENPEVLLPERVKKKSKAKKTIKWILIILLILILLCAGAVFGILKWLSSSYVADPEGEEINIESIEVETLPADVEKEMENLIPSSVRDIVSDDGVYNILLIGIDAYGNRMNAMNSDCMILMSLKFKTREIKLTSFMRDTMADIPVAGIRKLNAACALGGPTLTIKTIENNFGVAINGYAMVNLAGMESIVDTVGGINVPMTVAEAKKCDIDIDHDQVVFLDGKHAMLHMQERSSGGYDYMRTQRQRKVLMAIFEKAKAGGVGDIAKFVEAVLPFMKHNISAGDIFSLLTEMIHISRYTISEQRIPYDDLYTSRDEFLIPDYEKTHERLIESIYGEDGPIEKETSSSGEAVKATEKNKN